MCYHKNSPRSEIEQLYMLEIRACCLNLNNEKNVDASDKLFVRIGFPNLIPFEFFMNSCKGTTNKNQSKNKENSNPDETSYVTNSKKSYLFVKSPCDFVSDLQKMPLNIEVYKNEGKIASFSNDSQILCTTSVSLPQFLLEVALTTHEHKGKSLPLSRVAHDTYQVKDALGNVLGSISIILTLSYLGNSQTSTSNAKMNENLETFLNKESCQKNFSLKNLQDACVDPQTSSSKKLPLKRPESPPRITIDEPNFKYLTSAEMLNDHKYRDLVYQSYPDEPTCHCTTKNRSTHPMICRSGCSKRCCMALRNPEILLTVCKNMNQALSDTKASDELFSTINDKEACYQARLRGGGSGNDYYMNSMQPDSDMEFTWYGDQVYDENRLVGGGTKEWNNQGCVSIGKNISSPYRETEPESAKSGNPCSPQSGTVKNSCVCTVKDRPAVWKKGALACSKKPCPGIDCLLRAFKEAQEFVDSLGKIPGMVGLGLMDPSESPYFGRDPDKEHAIEDFQMDKRQIPRQLPAGMQCNAPCSVASRQQAMLGVSSNVSIPYSSAAYGIPITLTTTALPGRSGVVREALPILPDVGSITHTKQKKKEDKKEDKYDKSKEPDAASLLPLDVDVGPCGEPKCKSRRKKPMENVGGSLEASESLMKKSELKSINSFAPSGKAQGFKFSGKHYKHRSAGQTGPAGDRSVRNPIKVSKRVMRYVYSVGDAYPGINYGHKNCIDVRMRVPANMGWLWNTIGTIPSLKPRIGWRPGAISRYLNELLREAKAGSLQEEDNRPRSVPSRTRKGKVYRTMSFTAVKKHQTKKEGEEETEPPPTLHIHRKDGTYYVTMYPIKQETMDVPQLQEPMKPLQFKIVKNKDDASVASSSTASDMEIEFSPPAAVNRYRKKPDVIHIDTQVRQQEILDAFKSADNFKKEKKRKKKEGRK